MARPAILGNDGAVSEVVGSILLVSVTVVLAAGFALGMALLPKPASHGQAKLSIELTAGFGGWGTGDETVMITHTGGEILRPLHTVIRLTVGAASWTFTGATLGGPFNDGGFSIGETWTVQRPVSGTDPVTTIVTRTGANGDELLSYSTLQQKSGLDCTGDVAAPTASAWGQTPADVNTLTVGSVAVQATIKDGCSGVNTALAPHLYHRINGGGNPAFTDDGPMTSGSTGPWAATIPEPSPVTHWGALGGQALEYKIVAMTDYHANQADSAVQVDPIGANSIDTYPGNPAWAQRGTVASWTNVNGDDGLEARLLEAGSVVPGVVDRYGTTTSTSGSSSPVPSNPNNALVVSEGAFVAMPNAGQRIAVGGFSAASNPIANVELAIRAHYTGTRVDDTYQIRYLISGSTQSCRVTGGCDFAPTSTDTTRYVGVFSDRPWTWTDVRNLQVRAEYIQANSKDAGMSLLIDALWVRVTTADTSYALLVQANFTGVPFGLQHQVQLEYRVTPTESFLVQAFQPATSTWATVGAPLSSTTSATWTYSLSSAEYNSGSPMLRFVDQNPLGAMQGELDLDYLRVHTS